MELNIIVLAKQVPDTRNVGRQAMNADGTVNRSALPAIFNPALLLTLVVLALQIAEESGRIDLGWLREKVGQTLPFIHTIFPDPSL